MDKEGEEEATETALAESPMHSEIRRAYVGKVARGQATAKCMAINLSASGLKKIDNSDFELKWKI